mmetsp:Transcript_16289/g.41615  ORF Transcript_16289/g.41615 Transcript_16289/m.41615 type:complete len:288 (+) Transcript_16289:1040-1903(+)
MTLRPLPQRRIGLREGYPMGFFALTHVVRWSRRRSRSCWLRRPQLLLLRRPRGSSGRTNSTHPAGSAPLTATDPGRLSHTRTTASPTPAAATPRLPSFFDGPRVRQRRRSSGNSAGRSSNGWRSSGSSSGSRTSAGRSSAVSRSSARTSSAGTRPEKSKSSGSACAKRASSRSSSEGERSSASASGKRRSWSASAGMRRSSTSGSWIDGLRRRRRSERRRPRSWRRGSRRKLSAEASFGSSAGNNEASSRARVPPLLWSPRGQWWSPAATQPRPRLLPGSRASTRRS